MDKLDKIHYQKPLMKMIGASLMVENLLTNKKKEHTS